MALISKQVRALERLLQRMDAGTISSEEVNDRCKIHNLIYNQEKIALQTMALALVPGMSMNKIHQVGLINKNEVITTSLTDLEYEMTWCPDQDLHITRGDCLDYSGSMDHNKDCQTCKNFKLTRNLLVKE